MDRLLRWIDKLNARADKSMGTLQVADNSALGRWRRKMDGPPGKRAAAEHTHRD